MFFRAVSGDVVVSIDMSGDAAEPCAGNDAIDANFTISLDRDPGRDVTVIYRITGSATNGFDYSTISSTVTIPNGSTAASVNIHPLTNGIDFDKSVTLSLVLTNGYLVDPTKSAATIWIKECTTNFFTTVANNIPSPVGIDYHPPTKSLLLSVNFQGQAPNFLRLDTNRNRFTWSSVSGIVNGLNEIKIATVKSTAGAYTNGELFFANLSPGGIGWVSPNSGISILNWGANSALTNEPGLFAGSLYVDQTGLWGNDLFGVIGDDAPTFAPRSVWQVHSKTNATRLTTLNTLHLEGILTIPNTPAYGPWAGRLITGDEELHVTYAIETNGNAKPYFLGIDPDHFLLIPTNQDLYCAVFNFSSPAQSSVMKIDRSLFVGHVGDILIEQAGETRNPPTAGPILFIVRWSSSGFLVWSIRLNDFVPGFFEKVTFAPITIPAL